LIALPKRTLNSRGRVRHTAICASTAIHSDDMPCTDTSLGT
jgi:hypothetical protein